MSSRTHTRRRPLSRTRRSTTTRTASPVALAVAAVLLVGGALVVAAGLGVWPPQTAFAAPRSGGFLLGVNHGTAVDLGPRVDALDKFIVAAPVTATVSPGVLIIPAAKKPAPVPKAAPKPKPVAKKAAVKKPAKPPAKRAARSAGGWSSAKCSTYGIGDGLLGNGMAGGGKLRADSMVVAHRTLPFGTRIQFKYKGRTCIAEVRDRGPFIASRIFDLGPGTSKALKFSGVGTVSYKILGR